MKLASCSTALFLFWPLMVGIASTQKVDNTNVAKPGLHDIILKKMHDTASYLGFGVKCINGGHKTEENTCICPKYFKGKECETKICVNGAKLEKVLIPNVHHICKCPHPEFIGGEHCERIRCANQGEFKQFSTNATWQCDCKESRFYGGVFCEKFILSSGWIMAIACFGVFVIVAFICSSNWFSRNRDAHRRYNSHRCPPSSSCPAPRHSSTSRDAPSSSRRAAHSSHHQPRGGGMPRGAHRSSSSDDLISSERGAHRRTVAFPSGGITQQYVVRLDTIPTFNPTMIGGVEPHGGATSEQPPVGPPPSYDQAMSSIRAEPPMYTPQDTAAKLDA